MNEYFVPGQSHCAYAAVTASIAIEHMCSTHEAILMRGSQVKRSVDFAFAANVRSNGPYRSIWLDMQMSALGRPWLGW